MSGVAASAGGRKGKNLPGKVRRELGELTCPGVLAANCHKLVKNTSFEFVSIALDHGEGSCSWVSGL